MLKFFRKYNKWILVFGGVLLMIVFLLPQGGNMLNPSGRSQPVGEIAGREISLGERSQAANELRILEILGSRAARIERLFTTSTSVDDPLAWILAIHEAENLGLSASDAEARGVMAAVGIDDAAIAQIRASNGLTEDDLVYTLRRWLMIQRYRELALGLGHLSPVERLGRVSQIIGLANQLGAQAASLQGYIETYIRSAQGVPRFSEPLLERAVAGSLSQARVAFVAVPASIHAADVADKPLDADLLDAIYTTYRDALPGQGLPPQERDESTNTDSSNSSLRRTYSFGYRTPDRVKVEYFALDHDQLLAKSEVDFAQAMAYYNDNPGQFMQDPPAVDPQSENQTPSPTIKPFSEVRAGIMNQLRERAALELGGRIIQQARATLMEQVRQFPESNGYKRLPDDWSPMPLAQLATSLEEQFDVPVRVRRIDNEWLDGQALMDLEGIGQSIILSDNPRQQMPPFAPYVFSAETFEPDQTNTIARLRLQTKLPSHTMMDFEGNLYIFRLIEAQQTRAPESLDEVRDQVQADARKVLAYRALLDERDQWKAKLESQSLEAIATEAGTTVQRPQPFQRGSRLAAPRIEGVGVSRPFVEAVFDIAESFASPVGLKAAPSQARSTVVPLDDRLELAIVRIDDFTPIPRSRYLETIADPATRSGIYAQLTAARTPQDPLSLDALIERTGFKYLGPRSDDDAKADGTTHSESADPDPIASKAPAS